MARTWKLFPDDDRMGIASPSESLPCDRPIVQHFSCPGGCAINEIKGRNHPPLEDANLDGGLLADNRAGSLPLTRSRSAYRLSSRIARSECNSLQMVLTPCNFGLRDFATAGIVRLCRWSHPAVIRNIPPITPCSSRIIPVSDKLPIKTHSCSSARKCSLPRERSYRRMKTLSAGREFFAITHVA